MVTLTYSPLNGGVNLCSQKRKAQNRAAQRAFRERKDRHVKDLEAKVTALEEVTSKVADENTRLKSRLVELEAENNALKGSNITFTFPVTPDYDITLIKAIHKTTWKLFPSPL